MDFGYIKVAAAIPAVRVADVAFNLEEIEKQVAQAEEMGVEVVVFPELSITGYTCGDLFRQDLLIEKSEEALLRLLQFTLKLDITVIVGLPVRIGTSLFNCAAVVQRGMLLGLVCKTFLPDYNEFYEKRWFASASQLSAQTIAYAGGMVTVSPEPTVFVTAAGVKFGIEICEDVWAPVPPSTGLALSGADVIFNLSASDDLIGKHRLLRNLVCHQSRSLLCGYVYASCGFGESTTDVVYGGNAFIVEGGTLLKEAERFSLTPQLMVEQIDVERLRLERQANTTFRKAVIGHTAQTIALKPVAERPFALMRTVNPMPLVPASSQMDDTLTETLNIQVSGLVKRLAHTHCQSAVIGISGGLDSTLALLVTVMAFDRLQLPRTGITGVTMPGFGTTDRTYRNAISLMESLGITIREINIAKAVLQHFQDIGHDAANHDVTYENSQARERTQLLMDIANQTGGLVIGTGDLSELALGWCTYNGDHMSMYAVNVDVPKTLVQYLVRHVALLPEMADQHDTLLDIVDTPISPELIPADAQGQIAQKTEDLVGPYQLHDFFLYYHLRYGFRPAKVYMLAQKAFEGTYDNPTICHWLTTFYRRFFNQQFKRSCLPDGPKVGSVALSPRGDWRMPSDASWALWMKECEALEN